MQNLIPPDGVYFGVPQIVERSETFRGEKGGVDNFFILYL